MWFRVIVVGCQDVAGGFRGTVRGCQGVACGFRGIVRGSQGVAGGSGSSWVVAKVLQVVTRGILGGCQIVIKLFLLD